MNISHDTSDQIILKDSIFRIGKVFSVEGREVKINVDKQKNASHLIYKGKLLKNVSVRGYVKIMKGFTVIIGKVESEQIREDKTFNSAYGKEENKIVRILNVKLLGFFEGKKFKRGIKELPLLDNDCFLLDEEETSYVNDFVSEGDVSIRLGSLAEDSNQDVRIGVNAIFASHVGIFGNTGSGKSYTLAKLYRSLFEEFKTDKKFKENAQFLLFDFNGEYNLPDAVVSTKHVINLSTRDPEGKDKLTFREKDLLDIELFSIMATATEKTQRPFISRSLNFYKRVFEADDPLQYFKNVLRRRIEDVLKMSDKAKAFLLLDYMRELIPTPFEDGIEVDLANDLQFHNNSMEFTWEGVFLRQNPNQIANTLIYQQVDNFDFSENFISRVIDFLYLQLVQDVLSNRAQNDHIAPAINKLKSFQNDIGKLINIQVEDESDFWGDTNFVVVCLNEVNINMKKMIPLLVSHKLYSEHKLKKTEKTDRSLNIIVDEAHNILSYVSQRESETWKDYRLETFEEIIKEGRKFGVFLTIASQRPSDISPTIISQLHNYMLHRLINSNDIAAIEKTVSYLDKVSFDSLPILPTGVCILAGQMATVPVIVKVDEIEKQFEPNNKTIDLVSEWRDKADGENVK